MLFLILFRFSRSVISALSAISAVNTYPPRLGFAPLPLNTLASRQVGHYLAAKVKP